MSAVTCGPVTLAQPIEQISVWTRADGDRGRKPTKEEYKMTFRSFLVIKAFVCLFFGALLVLVPGKLFSILGATLGAAGTFAAREYGAAVIGTLMLTWFARNAGHTMGRRPILLHLLVYDAIGCVVTLLAVLSGVLNGLGWGIVAVYLFFTVGSFYLLIPNREVA
jgi:hypothetical protein